MKKKLLVLFLFIGLFCLESVAGDCPPGCAPSSIIDNVCEGCGSAGAAIGAGLTVFTYCVAKCATNCFCDGEPVPGCGRCLKRTFGS
ncbi:hypothetical protein HN446_04825, partial [bacterium]|nr:hypothetical protein [bacterium]